MSLLCFLTYSLEPCFRVLLYGSVRSIVVLVEIPFGYFFVFFGILTVNISFLNISSDSRVWESGLKSDNKAWDDMLIVPGFSVVC